jgi:hypothetical protein
LVETVSLTGLMMNLTKWIFPGIVATLALSAGTVWFQHSSVEQDLETRTMTALSEKFKWAEINARGLSEKYLWRSNC